MSKDTTFWQHRERGALRHLEQLDALCGISGVLSAGAERQDALYRVLDLLDKDLGLNRGTITLLSPDGREVRIEAVHDLSEQKSRNITYRIGEGVTGQVMQTGRAAIVPRVSREPLFLNRFERWNVTKEELSFICVPISVGDDVIGTISVDRPFDESAKLDEEVRILTVVAAMIANGMRVRREAEIEREALADENLRLRQDLESRIQRAASDTAGNGSFKDRVHLFERDLIVDALKRCKGNLAATARDLKATPRIIRHRVKELGIDYKRYSGKRGK